MWVSWGGGGGVGQDGRAVAELMTTMAMGLTVVMVDGTRRPWLAVVKPPPPTHVQSGLGVPLPGLGVWSVRKPLE